MEQQPLKVGHPRSEVFHEMLEQPLVPLLEDPMQPHLERGVG